ncbi:unnamed protein product [Chrysodeixis includens]|uniref:Carboxylesterase type B domain-containing protein n=1 Tax=Chrysodeixis includens TaxID=689277 RepID=A0A9P0BS58_CHRIL|nr:unnamed protein product [Chrysodeixis includens]
MYLKNVYISIALLICLKFVVCEEKPEVDTTHGKIMGKVLKTLMDVDYYGFMGIPYAVPPVGELRFLDPQPLDPWEGVLRTTKEQPACIQFNNDVKKGQSLGHYGSEDCLYLDVFTPAIDEQKRAVVMFIFNDHFLNSYNKSKDYAPDFFIREDVVVVTISHRLSALGFLSLEDDILPGNAGLKDIVQGLEWVKDNIEKFGGDPKRITLMGLQGGAAAIDLLIHSKAKDLFSGAILHSGTSWTSAYLQEEVKQRAFRLGELMNRTSNDGIKLISDLQEVPAKHLLTKDLHASPTDYFKATQKSVIAFAPIVERQEDGLITEYPEDSTSKIDIPILMGFNSLEGMEAMLQYLAEPRFLPFLKKDFPLLLPRRLKFKLNHMADVYDQAAKEIRDFYFTRGEINYNSAPDLITYMGDALTSYAMDYTAKTYSTRSLKPVYYYHFDYNSILNENYNNLMKYSTVKDGLTGAATGDEMCYLFKCPNLMDEYINVEEHLPEEKAILLSMIKMWTNFAKFGNPTPGGDEILQNFKWVPYTLENKQYLHIGKTIDMKRDLYKNRFDFWDQFIGKWERKAVDGIVTDAVNNKDEL